MGLGTSLVGLDWVVGLIGLGWVGWWGVVVQLGSVVLGTEGGYGGTGFNGPKLSSVQFG